MQSRFATYTNMGGRILVSTVLAAIITATAGAQTAPVVNSAEARTAIQAGYAEWGKARVALDMPTMEKILAPDFYFQDPGKKYTRQEFIDTIPKLKITRLDATVITVEPKGNDWSVHLVEKAEVETKDKDGNPIKVYVALVAKDDWRKLNDNQWILLSSEPLGQHRWKETPPIANW